MMQQTKDKPQMTARRFRDLDKHLLWMDLLMFANTAADTLVFLFQVSHNAVLLTVLFLRIGLLLKVFQKYFLYVLDYLTLRNL